MTIRPKKLLKGIILFSIFQLFDYFFGGATDGLNKMEKHIVNFLSFLPEGLAGVIGSLFVVVIGLTLVYCFVSGLFRICTCHQYIAGFEKWEK